MLKGVRAERLLFRVWGERLLPGERLLSRGATYLASSVRPSVPLLAGSYSRYRRYISTSSSSTVPASLVRSLKARAWTCGVTQRVNGLHRGLMGYINYSCSCIMGSKATKIR